MLDQETKQEVVEDILLHYGVRGMKWKKEKKKEEVRRKEQKELDNRPITKKVLDKLKGKKRPKYLTPFDK